MFKDQNDFNLINSNNGLFGQIDISDPIFGNIQQDLQKHQIQIRQIDDLQNQSIFKQALSIKANDPIQTLYIQKKKRQDRQKMFEFDNQSVQNSQNQDHRQTPATKYPQKSQKSKYYAKNYRQKKKQQHKYLVQENRFLKQKIDDLSFRLKQVQLQLNKLKHNNEAHTLNFQTTKQACLKQIQIVLQKNEPDLQKLLSTQKKLQSVNAFNNKHKLNLLNYFMSQLLENLVNDLGFYFIDSLIQKKGFWRQSQNAPLRKIDQDICDIFEDSEDIKKLKELINSIPNYVLTHFKNFKIMWKKLYQDYLNIINQGFLIQSLCQTCFQKTKQSSSQKQIRNQLKLQLFFQKIKYRKDIRQIRESWFKQFQKDEEQNRLNKNANASKKTKLICQ